LGENSCERYLLVIYFYRVGADSTIQYLVLQVHYASVDNIPPEGDDSGVFLQYTDEEQPKVRIQPYLSYTSVKDSQSQ
jgi:hypothetical protein